MKFNLGIILLVSVSLFGCNSGGDGDSSNTGASLNSETELDANQVWIHYKDGDTCFQLGIDKSLEEYFLDSVFACQGVVYLEGACPEAAVGRCRTDFDFFRDGEAGESGDGEDTCEDAPRPPAGYEEHLDAIHVEYHFYGSADEALAMCDLMDGEFDSLDPEETSERGEADSDDSDEGSEEDPDALTIFSCNEAATFACFESYAPRSTLESEQFSSPYCDSPESGSIPLSIDQACPSLPVVAKCSLREVGGDAREYARFFLYQGATPQSVVGLQVLCGLLGVPEDAVAIFETF